MKLLKLFCPHLRLGLPLAGHSVFPAVRQWFSQPGDPRAKPVIQTKLSLTQILPQLGPESAFSHYYSGLTKAYEGDVPGAIADFNQLVRQNPRDPLAYYNRGVLEVTKGDLDGGIADLDRAIQLSPNFARAYNDQGSVKAIKGDLAGAIAAFNRAIQLNPDFAEAHYNLGSVKARQGDLDGAIAEFNHSIQLSPELAGAFENLGVAKAKKGDLDAAIAEFNQGIHLNPRDPAAFENRAFAKQLKGDFDGALGDLLLSDELTPRPESRDYLQFYTWLVRARQGQPVEANQKLSAYLDSSRNISPEDWASKVGSFLLGRISEADFLAATSSPDPEKDRARHCEAWYYAGMKRLLAADKKTVADYFGNYLATGETAFEEYMLAQAELRRLGKN